MVGGNNCRLKRAHFGGNDAPMFGPYSSIISFYCFSLLEAEGSRYKRRSQFKYQDIWS